MAKPKYQFPEDPYQKFKSDLARELTAKHFPIRCGHKKDKKVTNQNTYSQRKNLIICNRNIY